VKATTQDAPSRWVSPGGSSSFTNHIGVFRTVVLRQQVA
jgi:hypothetical protein